MKDTTPGFFATIARYFEALVGSPAATDGKNFPARSRRARDPGMERILVNTPVPTFVLDPDCRILQISKSYLALAHLTLEECAGLTIYEFIEAKVPVPDVPTMENAIHIALETRNVHTVEDIATAQGTYWRVRVIPIYDEDDLLYIILEAEEITEQFIKRQALTDQLNTSDTFRILVETVKDYAIFLLDTNGHVATWNTGAELLKGYTPAEIIGKHFSTFYSQADIDLEKPKKELEAALRDGRVEDEGWRIRKDGTRFWANVIVTPVYRSKVHIGFSKVTRDLTERKAAESRLISAFEEASKLKSDFLANMSHEMRTPLNGALSALTLLLDTELNKDQKELASIIEESGTILLQLINDILDYHKLASGSFSLNMDVINISEVIPVVMRGFQAATNPEVRLETVLDSNLPKFVKGDPLRYRQIIQNLVGNATKFTDSGYIRVHASIKSEDDLSCTILTEVIDSGIGVPAQARNRLFTPFVQFENSLTKRYKGTGLGLSICKSLSELLSGEIGYNPNPEGHGSIFWFTVKLTKLDKDFSKPVPALTQPKEVKQLAGGKNLLVVEDNLINQRVMLKTLKTLGFENVDKAQDGEQAVNLVKDQPGHYHLILMDINMPVMDGVTATSEIRNMGLKIPIIAMTANALKGDAEAYLARGMDDYVAKPIDRRILVDVLTRWLT